MPDLGPIHHVKIPVSDVRASSEWYLRVLGLQVAIEFIEDGELRGVALTAPGGSASIALRHDPERAAALAAEFGLFNREYFAQHAAKLKARLEQEPAKPQ